MSNDSENDMECTPPEVREAAMEATNNLFPKKSKEVYESYYAKFMEWRNKKKIKSFSETAVLAYFAELSNKMKPSTLWKIYSMLKTTLNIKHNIDISKYAKLHAFLKRKSDGYCAKKSKTLTADEAKKFINEAPDNAHLATKVALIVGMMGACRKYELYKMKMEHIQDLGKAILISVPDTKTKLDRQFTITGEFCEIVKKYLAVRSFNTKLNNFFLKYCNGRCVNQVIGINKLGGMPKAIAEYLNLENPQLYTGHCFRRTSATFLIDAGADITTLKRHGGWKSTSVAESYIDHSINNKINVGNKIMNCVIEKPQTITHNASTSSSVTGNTSTTDCDTFHVPQSVVHENTTSQNVCSLPNFNFYNCTNNITINFVNKNE